MKKTRVRIVVELDLDPMYGFNHGVQDYADRLRHDLAQRIPHYNPTVDPAEFVPLEADLDEALYGNGYYEETQS